MVESAALEPLALDVVRDPVSDLGGRLDRFAGHLSDRMRDFGGGVADDSAPSLLRSLSDRWSMPGAGAGLIEVFHGSDFGGLVRHWGSRSGYDELDSAGSNPFVIPVDPIEHVEGISGAHLRRPPDRRRAMRPVALRPQRPVQRPRAIERWRPVSSRTAPTSTSPGPQSARFSAYPAAMGQAGAIDATLLRFPTAQAEISDGPDRAVVTDQSPGTINWAPTRSRTPAVQAAERISAAVAARLAPEPAAEVGAWLVPAASPTADDHRVRSIAQARMARPRIDARVPIAAFEARIGPSDAVDEPTRASAWDAGEVPGVLVEPTAKTPGAADPLSPPGADPTTIRGRASRSEDAPRADQGRSQAPDSPITIASPQPRTDAVARVERAAADELSAQIIDRLVGSPRATQSPVGLAQPDAPRTTSRATRPWDAPIAAAPGRPLFVPAALAQLAEQLGQAARPSATPDADWPWARPMPTPTTFAMADRAADGVLVEQAMEPVAPTATTAGDRPIDRPTAQTSKEPARPPDAVRAIQTKTARQAARLEQLLSSSAAATDPVSLATLLADARGGLSDTDWRAQVAAEPAISQVLAQVDRLTARGSMTAPLPAIGAEAPPQRRAPNAQRASNARTHAQRATHLDDGLSVLTGAPASATLFAPSWAKASPVVRAMLSAAGFGPEAGQPGPSFSFGERLAAVAADLSSRHGLSTESTTAGGLDAAWFSEPTGTLVLPMSASEVPEASGTTRLEPRDLASPTLRDARPAESAAHIAGAQGLNAGPALQAALRGARRRGPAARLRPVPRLQRMTAAISPEAMAMLTQTQAMTPAIVDVLARAERLFSDAGASAISTLARHGDMPSLVTLARLADAPDALAALSDRQQAPGLLRALARIDAPVAGLVSDDADPLRASARLDQSHADPSAAVDALDAVLVAVQAESTPEAHDLMRAAAVDSPRPARVPRAQLAESLSKLTNALPAAVRAALASATSATARGAASASVQSAPSAGAPRPARPAAARTAQATPDRPLAAVSPSLVAQKPFKIGAIGQVARRAVDWAQRAEASAPRGFEALATQTGDTTQSPIARRVLTPRAMVTDDSAQTWLALPGQAASAAPGPSVEAAAPSIGRTRAAPIGAVGRRSAAQVHALDGLGQAPGVPGRRSIWQAPDAWTFIASATGAEAVAQGSAPMTAARSANRTADRSPTSSRAPIGTQASTAMATPQSADRARGLGRSAMGVPGGKLRWPQATFNWVQAAAGEAPAINPGAASSARVGYAAQTPTLPAFAGIAGLRSLSVSDRVLAQSLGGLGVLRQTTTAASATDPLRPISAQAPRVALELALPGAAEAPASGAERFAEQTLARQVPITRGSAASAPSKDGSGEAPTLDVDWVRPVKATAAEAAQLAPRFQSPGNINRALDVWVDAVQSEASRSPAAARQAMGSVGQLIAQFSTRSASSARVRPSNVLRGSVFDGRSPSPVTIEAPQDGDARPALIRPGEHAARQALRKGTDTVQTPQATTTEDARHKNSEQTDELIPPEEVERLAAEVIDRIKRELEFDAARMGEDGWD